MRRAPPHSPLTSGDVAVHNQPSEIRLGPAWYWFGVLGVAVNFAGGVLWLGVGPALFVTGALLVAFVWCSVALVVCAGLVHAATVRRSGKRRRHE